MATVGVKGLIIRLWPSCGSPPAQRPSATDGAMVLCLYIRASSSARCTVHLVIADPINRQIRDED